MKPKKKLSEPQDDMFRPRLEDIVSPTHPLGRLASVIDWDRVDRELDHHFATVGAAALPNRLMTGLMYLQHMQTSGESLFGVRYRYYSFSFHPIILSIDVDILFPRFHDD